MVAMKASVMVELMVARKVWTEYCTSDNHCINNNILTKEVNER